MRQMLLNFRRAALWALLQQLTIPMAFALTRRRMQRAA